MPDFPSLPALVITSGAVLSVSAFAIWKWWNGRTPKALSDTSVRHSFPLIAKHNISHNTRLFEFGLPSSRHVLGLPIGQHLSLSCEMQNPRTGEGDKQLISRQYTPISSDQNEGDRGTFKLVVKIYPHSQHPNFPNGGWMSQHLDSMKIGEHITVKGPSGRLRYLGHGDFKIRKNVLKAKKVGMIAGGTGVTPMFQLLQHVLSVEREGDMELSLLFANQTPEDILIREELEKMAKENPGKFSLHFTVDRVGSCSDWKGFVGFVSKDMIQKTMPEPSEDSMILMCGPPPMIEKCCQPALAELGFDADRTFAY